MIKFIDGKNFNPKVGGYADRYDNPWGYFGEGKDIGWCSRHSKDGKICSWCGKRSYFLEWSYNWMWYYLIEYGPEYARHSVRFNWLGPSALPSKYTNTGLSSNELKSVFNKGCLDKKRCKCASIIQRAFWVCPQCFVEMNKITSIMNCHIHDLFIARKETLKRNLLIYRLSGVI